MKNFLVPLYVMGYYLHAMTPCLVLASEFHLEGDYLIGGLFDIHHYNDQLHERRPEAAECSSAHFLTPNYRRLQLMRFSVEEINNSSSLLPNVSLGYEMFDHCSDPHSFPGIFKLISVNGLIKPWPEPEKNLYNVIGVVGPFSSTQCMTVAPLFMSDLIPVVSYGCSASFFSSKSKCPSFLRTVHPNKDIIEVIVNIILHFDWRWVAFLNSDNDFGTDGLELFIKTIKDTEICLAYTKALNEDTNYSQIFEIIEEQKVNVIIVFAPKMYAEAVIESAVQMNITNKVWIADDGWSLNKRLPKMKGIKNIGTVLGVSQPIDTIPGFTDFMYSTKREALSGDAEQQVLCSQICNCSNVNVEDIVTADPSFSFPVYSAVYAVAHALHNVLQCGAGRCDTSITVHPQMVLEELKRSNFMLLNHSINFDENGDPKFGPLSIVFWNNSGEAQEIGFYYFQSSVHFYINDTKIQWYTNGEVPTARCSQECPPGYAKKQTGVHKCCFTCEICPSKTYVNSTEDSFRCIDCKDTEWSPEGSMSCSLRLVEYIPLTDIGAIVVVVMTWVLVGLTLGVLVLFAVKFNTPVVRSAGGPMCFLILGCLSLCSVSVFFYFGVPTDASCILRYLPFLLFFPVCLACFVVRSFQIVCIFKISAKFPKLHSWWMNYHGQWLLITVAFVTQTVLLIISFSYDPPKPYNETFWYPDQIVLTCDLNLRGSSSPLFLLVLLGCLCFIFSYMGKDLPKNYNEAKAITFCLFLLILNWIIFVTQYMLYRGKYINTFNALALLSSLYIFLLCYFLPKCYIIIFQPTKNTQQHFQGLIQNYTKTISQ